MITLIWVVILFFPGGILGMQDQSVITSADLRTLPDPACDRFMRRVYNSQVKLWSAKKAVYAGNIPGAFLKNLPAGDSLPGRSIQLHRDIIDVVRKMLKDARKALSRAKSAGLKKGRHVIDIRIRSAYRSASKQFSIWERNYPKYYKRTREHRRTLEGGEHGERAMQFLAKYINQRVFSPGYSPHQHGKAVDFTYKEDGVWAEADTSPESILKWEESWLFFWLGQHGAAYGFTRNPDINEPWHWEYDFNLRTLPLHAP